MPRSIETDDLRNTLILHFLPHNYLPLGGGHETFHVVSPDPTDTTY